MQNSTKEIVDVVKKLVPEIKSGTLRFYGVWFGKPYDNYHKIKDVEILNGSLKLYFEDDETLEIWNATDYTITLSIFEIRSASRVRWQRYYYGKEKIEKNLFFYDFKVADKNIESSSNVDWYKPEFNPSIFESAVKIY